MKLKQKFLEFVDYSEHDPWGYVMMFAFDLNAIAFNDGLETDSSYKPGLGGALCEDEYLNEQYNKGLLSDKDIEDLIRFTSKLIYKLDKAGYSY